MRRPLKNSVWRVKGAARQVLAIRKKVGVPYVLWVNVRGCDRHWQSLESWNTWVEKSGALWQHSILEWKVNL